MQTLEIKRQLIKAIDNIIEDTPILFEKLMYISKLNNIIANKKVEMNYKLAVQFLFEFLEDDNNGFSN